MTSGPKMFPMSKRDRALFFEALKLKFTVYDGPITKNLTLMVHLEVFGKQCFTELLICGVCSLILL